MLARRNSKQDQTTQNNSKNLVYNFQIDWYYLFWFGDINDTFLLSLRFLMSFFPSFAVFLLLPLPSLFLSPPLCLYHFFLRPFFSVSFFFFWFIACFCLNLFVSHRIPHPPSHLLRYLSSTLFISVNCGLDYASYYTKQSNIEKVISKAK